MHWIVDAMNVIGSRPDGWWRDRAGAMAALAERLTAFAAERGEPVTVVYDGRPRAAVARAAGAGVEVAFAPSADDEIVRRVAAAGDPGAIRVVTSDAELERRVREHGAGVAGAGGFRRELDAGA